MFDSEDSDSSVDDETLAWIDQYPDLELNARTFRHLERGAVASVPECITREEDVAAHAKDTLAKILTMCSREEVDLIRNVDNATELISQKQLILEQAERLEREQKEAQGQQRSDYMREYNRGEQRRQSERVRGQGRSEYMGEYNRGEPRRQSERVRLRQLRSGMSEVERAQVREADSLAHAFRRANMSEEEQRQMNQQSRERMAHLRSQRRDDWEPAGRACKCNIDTFNPDNLRIKPNDLGPMGGSFDRTCSHCGAKGYKDEMRGTSTEPHMGQLCCNQGKIELPRPSPFPIELYKLLTEQTPEAKEFRKRIRYFNSGMAAASLEVKDASIYKYGAGAFRVHGQMYSRIGPPLTSNVYDGGRPKCLQIFFYDAEEQANIRSERSYGPRRSTLVRNRDRDIFRTLQSILTVTHRYIRSYLTINEDIERRNINPDTVRLVIDPAPRDNRHRGRFNVPGANEVSVLLADDDDSQVDKHAIVTPMRQVDPNQNPIRRIPDHHRAHDPLLYPLLTPYGEDGWHRGLRSKGKKVSVMQFWRYRVMDRDLNLIDPNDGEETVQRGNPLHLCGKLFQQWTCDCYARVDSENLNYIRTHQKELRADSYAKVQKRVAENTAGSAKPVVLPSSYTGSDRYFHKKMENAMALSRALGKPNFFITFTMNPFCKEVMEQLEPGQIPYDRPDIIARVYWQKYKAFIKELEEDGILGKIIGRVSVVEFQKRGAPHTHTLIWIKDFNPTPANIDRVISAEIPEKGEEGSQQRVLHDLVMEKMIHGPCKPGYPCWRDGRCEKGFPFDFKSSTSLGEAYYPEYRRRSPEEGGHTGTKRGVEIDNRWVIPYNAYLLMKYGSHINIQYVVSIASIKYLFKYNFKGGDMMTVGGMTTDDEIETFVTKRYISSGSGAWRMFKFGLVQTKPTVTQLDIHLENNQFTVYEDVEGGPEEALKSKKDTMLTAYFLANQMYPEARDVLYESFPDKFVWKADKKIWTRRTHGRADPDLLDGIGRMPLLSPYTEDLFYQRLLLKHKTGATSFKDLRTVNGIECETFNEACVEMGLVENDRIWIECMAEASAMKMPPAMRDLFCNIIVHCNPAQKRKLFDLYEKDMMDDFVRQRSRRGRRVNMDSVNELSRNDMLVKLNNFFQEFDKSNETYGIPMPNEEVAQLDKSNELDTGAEEFYDSTEPLLNDEQQQVLSELRDCVTNNTGGFYGIDAPAGSGKTFLMNTVLCYVRKEVKIAIATAIPGIAALLLRLGTTFHKRFRPPRNPQTDDTCQIELDSDEAKIIKDSLLILIDEASMMQKELLDCLDTWCKTMMGCYDKPFGGKLVVVVFDLRQIPPVVVRGFRPDIAAKSIKNSRVWPHIKLLHLQRNMRVERLISSETDPVRIKQLKDHARWLLSIGDGNVTPSVQVGTRQLIEIPDQMICNSPEDLNATVFPSFEERHTDPTYLAERSILVCTNDLAMERNNEMVERIPGEAFESYSIDYCMEEEDKARYDTDTLNQTNSSGLPPHFLYLKRNACIILLRSLNPKIGFCNGSRCLLKNWTKNLLIVQELAGERRDILVPRVPMECTESKLGIPFVRRQFPILLSYYLTLNRSQGKTLDTVGLELPESVFMHGHVYVGSSRTGDPEKLHIYANQEVFEDIADKLEDGKTYIRNEVWKEMLT